MTTHHWGEIPEKPTSDFFIPDVTADIERSMDKFCLAEYQDEGELHKTDKIVFPSMDPLMMYAISLHKHANDKLDRVAKLATEKKLSEDAPLPMPIMPKINVKHKRNSLNFMPKDLTPFVCGWDMDITELNDVLLKKILAKCVAVMFAHIGFETTHQSVLDVLTDVLESFYQKFCHKLVDVMEEEEKGNTTGFPHTIERILTETGMGGVKGLNDYYQNRIVKYVNVLQKRCIELNDQYAVLLIPKNISPTDKDKIVRLRKVRVEEDENVVEIDNAEVHFAAFDGETSVLEPGYQLLNSLEAEENLQSLGDVTEENLQNLGEEAAGEDTSGVVFIPPETEICSVVPLKKKKIK